jgi:secondary thiamine-phosphate synthase enzyme
MQKSINIPTNKHNGLFDVTRQIESIVSETSIKTGLVNVYVQGATAGIMIQENWDNSVQTDVVTLLDKLIPHGIWQHDAQDNNGDSHLKAGLVGPSECIPIINGKMGLSTWQNIFLCEFDGPRENRTIIVTIIDSEK